MFFTITQKQNYIWNKIIKPPLTNCRFNIFIQLYLFNKLLNIKFLVSNLHLLKHSGGYNKPLKIFKIFFQFCIFCFFFRIVN